MELGKLMARYSVPLAVVAGVYRQVALIRRANEYGQLLTSSSRAFERTAPRPRARILVFGDSTGVGVGAERPELSLAGLIASDFSDVEIVNVCQPGARLADVLAHVRSYAWGQTPFDLIMLHVGGNDIVYSTPLRTLANNARALLALLSAQGRRVIWLGPPNIGNLPLFEPPLSWWMTKRSRKVRQILADAATRGGAEFVDFFRERADDPCASDPERYFAADRFHPSAEYYRYGYEVLLKDVRFGSWL